MQGRQTRWQRYEALLSRAEAKGLIHLHAPELEELYGLYRLVCSDLNLAQTRTGNPALLDYLEAMAARGYSLLTPPKKVRPLQALWHAVWVLFPGTLRAQWRVLGLAISAMVLGVAFGAGTTAWQPDLIRTYMPPMFAAHLAQTPAERVAEAEQAELNGTRDVNNAGSHAAFSSQLMTHNIRVSVMMLGLGLTFGIGTAVLLFYNGVIIGTLGYAYFADGMGLFFIAWVGPHGSIELPAIIIAGSAGLMIGRAQWASVKTRGGIWRSLRPLAPGLLSLMAGVAVLLVIAGFVEGGFSQVNEPTLPYPLKIAVAGLLFLGLVFFGIFAGKSWHQRSANS